MYKRIYIGIEGNIERVNAKRKNKCVGVACVCVRVRGCVYSVRVFANVF